MRGGNAILKSISSIPISKTPLLSATPTLPIFNMKYSIAGGIANAVSHSLVLPIDVVKTKQQIEPIKYDGNFLSAGMNMIRTEGFSSLFSSIFVASAVYFMEGVIKHGLYDNYKGYVAQCIPLVLSLVGLTYPLSKTASNAISSVMTAIITSIIMLPWDTYRVTMLYPRDIVNNNRSNHYSIDIDPSSCSSSDVTSTCHNENNNSSIKNTPMSTTDCSMMLNTNSVIDIHNMNVLGIREHTSNTNIGTLIALLCKQIPNTLAKHSLFESIQNIFKMLLKGYLPNSIFTNIINFKTPWVIGVLHDSVKFEWLIKISAAYVTSLITAIVSQPGDVLYTNMILNKEYIEDSSNNNSIYKLHSIIKDIYTQYGILGFFKGILARFMHSSIVVTSQLLIYDAILK